MKTLPAVSFILCMFLFSCGPSEELESLRAENEELKKEIKKFEHLILEEKKLAKYAKEEAETAKRRAEEILKDCKKK